MPSARPSILLFLSLCLLCSSVSAQEKRQIAITIDDGPAVKAAGLEDWLGVAEGLRESFEQAKAPVIMFINEHQLDVFGQREERHAFLEKWLDAGFELGNHTYSHKKLRDTPIEEYFDDIVRGEKVTRPLLEERGEELVWYRYPYLSSGRGELATRVEKFLAAKKYRIAPVTVDYHDYSFTNNYSRFLRAGNQKEADRVYEEMTRALDVAFDRAEKNSEQFFGRQIKHVLLIHCNELNAKTLPITLKRIRDRGYEFITLEEAMKDPAYATPGLPPGSLGGSFFGGMARIPK